MKYIARDRTERFQSLTPLVPALLIVGPRQCGKSTLARRTLPDWTHLDLERPADLAVLAADLEGFFDAHPRSVVVDESQRLPELFSFLRYAIDRRKGGFFCSARQARRSRARFPKLLPDELRFSS